MSFVFTKPTLITISGPTGSGKTYLHDYLLKQGLVTKACSVTSRKQRAGEKEGVDYNFLSAERIEEMLEQKLLIEHNVYLGNHYGRTRESFLNHVYSNTPLAVIVDPNGVQTFQKVCAEHNIDILRVFVHTAKSLIEQRLFQRANDERIAIERNISIEIGKLCSDQIDGPEYHDIVESSTQKLFENQEKALARIKNYNNEESRWLTAYNWDVIVSGTDDPEFVVDDIMQAVAVKNRKNEVPQPHQG